MKRAEALKLLELPDQAAPFTKETVDAAFRAACWKHHPDAQGQSGVVDLTIYQDARKTLLLELNGQNNACPQCRGRGMVQARVGMRACGACKGSGDKAP